MNRQQLNTQCDSDRIELFLRGTLSRSETEILELHLTECKSCARQIELAAEQGVSWQEAHCLLAVDEYDSPQHMSAISSLLADEHAPMTKYQTADVLSREIRGWLDPTDDPHSMGRFAGYEIVGIVGHGGMGIVLKGFEASLNRYVAIKILAPRLATNGSARKRFAREAQAAAAVRHDNVIAIHRVAEWHGLPFLVMPYAGGISLQKRIDSDGPLSIEQTLRVGVQIASGLAAAHAQGLIHRDIKPANILVEQGVERVTITDFGLARAADDASVTRTGVIAGTPQYMSPEQAEAKQLDARSDLFSLGSVLYAMATGRPPFRGAGSFEVLNRIVNESARSMREIESSVPEWFENTVNRLHSKSPNDRPASACEVAELLQGCLAHVQRPTTTPMPAGVQALAAHAHASTNNVTLISRLKAGLQQTKFIAAAAFAFSLIFAGVLIVLEFNKGTLTIESEVDDVPIRIMQGAEPVEKFTLTRSGETVRIAAGDYIVEIDGQTDGITVEDGIVSLQRRGTETVRIVYSGDRAHGSATLAPGADEFATSESDSEFALRKFGDKITVDLYGGSDVLSQMNTRGTNKEKYMRLLLELNAIKGVVTNFRAAGSGNNISMAIVRDPSSQCSQENRRTGKPSETRNAINAALEAAGITSVRWEEGGFSQKSVDIGRVPGVDDSSAAVITPTANRAWQQTDLYVAPNFNSFFPDDKDRGPALDALWNAHDKDSRTDDEILKTVREGFRNTSQHRMPILRWIGNKYIWNKSPQNPDAIEIMYHAADFSGEDANPSGARHAAVYFGLSVTQPKTPAILRTLAELAMRVDDPNDLERIAWGSSNQKAELLEYLKPFQESDDKAVLDKAEICSRIFSGELKAFVWAAEQAHQRAEKTYSSQLPQFKETLISGSSEERLKALQTILGQRIALIMDDSFVAAFAKCAEDNDPQVRVQTTIIAGAKWVWEAQEKQHPEAIQLMLRLSTDEHRDVRYNAVYYGLSTVRSKSDDVIRRLLEMAFEDREQNLFRRIEWGLRDDRERVAPILNGYIDGSDKIKAKAAREIFKQLTGSEPPLVDTATANDPAHTIVG